MNEREAGFVESMGLLWEQQGLPRMSGRMLGWLLICQPAEQSSLQLAEALQASKGSISAMSRLLIQIGLLERVSRPGDRRDYYRIKDNAWADVLAPRMLSVSALRRVAEEAVAITSDLPPPDRRRAEQMLEMYEWFEREMADMVQRWERLQKEKRNHGDNGTAVRAARSHSR